MSGDTGFNNSKSIDLETHRRALKSISFGKRLPGAIYVFRPGENDLPVEFLETIRRADLAAKPDASWNLLKIHTDKVALTFLTYPDFETDPHPALAEATMINLNTGSVVRTCYRARANPPILHRKETFLPPRDSRIAHCAIAGFVAMRMPIGTRAALRRSRPSAFSSRRMSAAVIAKCWTFASSRGGHSYQTLLYADGSTSCDCPGWCKRTAPDSSRSCKHTRCVLMGTADRECESAHDYRGSAQIPVPATTPASRPDRPQANPNLTTMRSRRRSVWIVGVAQQPERKTNG